jgi:hypothetical protein
MYRLYILLKDRKEPPTPDEIAIASGRKALDPEKAATYLNQLEKASTTIVDLFHRQAEETKACDSNEFTFPCTDTFFFFYAVGQGI